MSILSDELANDPLTRGYAGMTDQQAADDLNTVYRPISASIESLIDYLKVTRTHTNQGSDTAASNTTPSNILGRLKHAAEQTSVPADPFGAGSTPSDKRITNTRELHAVKALYELVTSGAQSGVNFVDSEIQTMLNDCISAGVFNTAHRDAMIALSENQQTRAQELGIPKVSAVKVGASR